MNEQDSAERRFYMSLETAGHTLEDLRTDTYLQRMFRLYTGREWHDVQSQELSQPVQRTPWDGFRLIGSRETQETSYAVSPPSNTRKSSPAPRARHYRIPRRPTL